MSFDLHSLRANLEFARKRAHYNFCVAGAHPKPKRSPVTLDHSVRSDVMQTSAAYLENPQPWFRRQPSTANTRLGFVL